MEPNFTSRTMPASKLLFAGILLAGAAANALLSPKWVMPVFAWVAPACLLYYFRYATLRFRVLWFALALIASQIVSAYNVFPFPWPVMAILTVINTLKLLVLFFIDMWASKKSNAFFTTLVFPALYVTKEFIDVTSSGGSWWSIANTQYSFSWLAQLSSVTGLAGISFVLYWFASVAVWIIQRYFANESYRRGLVIYAGVFTAVMSFGAVRFYSDTNSNMSTVKVAGLTVPTISLLEAVYKDVSGQSVILDLKTSLTSAEYQRVNTALIPFIENPDTARFINGYKALCQLHNSLFAESKEAADNGAKIITWSEANAVMPRAMQAAFIKRGQDFARENKVYLLMALGVFDTGKITMGKNFLENKTILVSPTGTILNVFHKNHPVPYAEHSTPGDGKVPVVATLYGKLSVSICYDADMPGSMQQLGKQKADMIFLPSGDWYDIAPYHTYMAAFRGIENGCTVIRQANGGLSLVTDYRGKTQASLDFYKPGEKLWTADIVTGHVFTVYSVIGDAFAYACVCVTIVVVLLAIGSLIFKKRVRTIVVTQQGGPIVA